MKKVLLVCGLLFSGLLIAQPLNPEKKLKLEVSLEWADVMYGALGKLPAEQSEPIRAYMKSEFEKQFPELQKDKK